MNNRIEYLMRSAMLLALLSLFGLVGSVMAQTTTAQMDTLYVFESGDVTVAISKETAKEAGMNTAKALWIVLREKDCEVVPFSILENGREVNYFVRSRTPGVRCDDQENR